MEALSLEWGQAGKALQGQNVTGDACCVAPFDGGLTVAVIDALGHGPGASETAALALEAVRAAAGCTLAELFSRCHAALQKTRGVAMSAAVIRPAERSLTWAGVGNVEGLLLREGGEPGGPRERLLLKGGVVGYQMPSLRASVFSVGPGDALVFATDGIRQSFVEEPDWRFHGAQDFADSIFRRFGTGIDDALVWAARFKEAE